jgi:hypothetical protein
LIAGYRAAGGPESADAHSGWLKSWREANPVWRGVHLSASNDEQAGALAAELPKLAGLGVNVIVLEVDYNFQFRSHPEIAPSRAISAPGAGALAQAARNGTHPALDLIPTDIIVCDWHYEKQAAYPSVPLLLQKGFRVWPPGWQPLEATKAFSAFARQQNDKRLLGYLCATWGKVRIPDLAQWPPVAEVLPAWRRPAEVRSPNAR